MALKVHDSSSLRSQTEIADRPAQPRLPTSMWALMALICALLMLPPFPILAIVLGVIARRSIARTGDRTGVGPANVAIGLGATLCVMWMAAGVWLYVNIRVPITEGPVDAVAAAIAGDVDGMVAEFHDGADAPHEEAAAFAKAVKELSLQFGAFEGFEVDDDLDRTRDQLNFSRPFIPYRMVFESGSIRAEAQYLVADPEGGLALRFKWIRIFDPIQGKELMFPLGADSDDADADLASEAETGAAAESE